MAAEHKQPAALTHPILTSPMQYKYQTRSQRPIAANTARNTTLLPRVVTPMTGQAAYPRMPARIQNISPQNLSPDNFWNMETTNLAIGLGANHCSQEHFAHAVVHPVAGKQMEYMSLMKEPDLQPLWKRAFSNEAGRLFQDIHNIPGTNTCFFVKLKKYTKGQTNCIWQKKIGYKPHKK
jgi:hypothetical protein